MLNCIFDFSGLGEFSFFQFNHCNEILTRALKEFFYGAIIDFKIMSTDVGGLPDSMDENSIVVNATGYSS